MTTKKSPANSVIAKRRCMYGILIGAMFVIVANLSITALLLYYINISKVFHTRRFVSNFSHNSKSYSKFGLSYEDGLRAVTTVMGVK